MTNSERLIIYRKALKEIAKLEEVTEIRGPLEDMDTPEHLVKSDGWVPVHPQLKRGLVYAARIAQHALEERM